LGALLLIAAAFRLAASDHQHKTRADTASARGTIAMPDTITTNSPIIAGYRAATPGSAAAAAKASSLFPSGITHDSRYIEPYGLYITRAKGPRKWDVDGNEYVDYFGGHATQLMPPLPLLGACSRLQIPVEDFDSVPVQDSGVPGDMLVDSFEIFDAMWLAADIGVDRNRHNLGPLRPFIVKPVEGVDAAGREIT
jgi:hypothetical protein